MTSNSSKSTSETETMVKNAGVGFIGQGIFVIIRFAINIIITKAIGPESYGFFVLAMTVISFLEVQSLFGMESTIVKFVAEYIAKRDILRLKGTILWGIVLSTLVSIILGVALFGTADLIAVHLFHKEALIPVLRVIVISVPFTSITTILLAAIQGANRIKYKVLVQRIQIPLLRFVSIMAVVFMGYKLMGIVWTYVFVAIAGIIIGCYYLNKTFNGIFREGPVVIERRKITFFSTQLLFSGLFLQTINKADILIMGYFLPASIIGIYGIVTRIPLLLSMPLNSVNATFGPIISGLNAKSDRERLEQQFKTMTRYVLTLSLPIFALIFFFPDNILSLFGPAFVEGDKALLILMAGQMINVATGSSGLILMMTGKVFVNLINSGIFCVLNIIMNIILIPKYGMIGAAWSSTIAISAIQVCRLVEVWFILKIQPYSRDIMKPVLSSVLASWIFLLVYYLDPGINREHIGFISILCLLYLASYVLFLWFFKFSPEDYIVLRNLKKRLLFRVS